MLAKGVVLPVMSNQKVDAYLKEITNLAKISKLSNELRNITNSPNTLTALFQ